jgi:hypothetical protein
VEYCKTPQETVPPSLRMGGDQRDVTPDGLRVVETFNGLRLDDLQRLGGARLLG